MQNADAEAKIQFQVENSLIEKASFLAPFMLYHARLLWPNEQIVSGLILKILVIWFFFPLSLPRKGFGRSCEAL